jgi:signal transduction histidine kinase/CheY-like chemotaxis protein
MLDDATWRQLLDALPDPVNVKDRQGRWLYANPAMLRAFRLEGLDYRGKRDSELVSSEHFYHPALCYCERSDAAAWEGAAVVRTIERLPRPEGGTDPYDVVKVPVPGTDGSGRLLVSSRSATALIESQEALAASLQDAELGRLLPGLVHDLNNLLTIILGHADLAAGHPERTQEATERIIAATGLCRELTASALGLVRGESGRHRSIDLRAWLPSVVRLCWPRDEYRTLSLAMPDQPLPVLCDAAMLGRAVLNLLVNARQWTGPHGRIQVQLAVVGRLVELAVDDDGPGIAPEDQNRVFQTGFTRREQGNGLGLLQVARCAEVHGGSCHAGRSLWGGCRIGLRLPQHAGEARTSGEIPMPGTQRGLRVGICDPDPIIAAMAQRLVGSVHRVGVYTEPQALAQAAIRGELDCVISDLDSPFLDGMALQHALCEAGSMVPLVLTVANVHDLRLRSGPPAGTEVLYKPYRCSELLTAIDRAVARRCA